MIITFDSGILVQAAERSQGSARRALDLVLDNPSHTLAISPYILGEVGKVLAYPRIQARLEISGERIHAYVSALRARCHVVEPVLGRPVVLHDPKDDHVLYTAVAARADILCARDRHFRDA